MTAREAVRIELAKVREKRAALEAKEAALDAAYKALVNGAPTPTRKRQGRKGQTGRTRTFKGTKSRDERKGEILAYLQARPNEQIGASELRLRGVAPHSSAQRAIEELVAEGKVVQVATTNRGNPIVAYNASAAR